MRLFALLPHRWPLLPLFLALEIWDGTKTCVGMGVYVTDKCDLGAHSKMN